MQRKSVLGFLSLMLVAAACTGTRPTAPEFTESSTTTTTIPDGSGVTTTTVALPPPEEQIIGTVVDVVDGDTLTMTVEGATVDVRLDGINAPETSECWGPESTALLNGLVSGQQLILVAGETDQDQFGRLLRYAYLDNEEGTTFVNAEMVRDGNALAVQNGGPHVMTLKALEARAFQSGKGMWGTVICGDEEALRADRPVVRVAEVEFDPAGPDDDALGEEYVTFVNEGYGRVSFSGWVLRDESSSNRLTFPSGVVLAPGDTVTVVTGCDGDGGPAEAIRWCSDSPVWSNGGDTIIVSDTFGNAVIWFTYDGT